MNCFATFFDVNYLSRGLVLLQSLKQHSKNDFKLFILALDEDVRNYFISNAKREVEIILLGQIEREYPELLDIKPSRSEIEYYFTLSPYLPLYILKQFPGVHRITTLDADILFYSDPDVIFTRYEDASVLITPHNFSPGLEALTVTGIYNVSFQSFRNDMNALTCLNQWRADCRDWCYDYLDKENGRYADQKYLDNWKNDYQGVQEIRIPGTGLAPWNLLSHHLEEKDGKFLVDDQPLIYFHFHGLKLSGRHFAISGVEGYGADSKNKIVKSIYHTYLKLLNRISKKIKRTDGHVKRNALAKQNMIVRILKTNGFWYYDSLFIVNVNIYRHLAKIRRKLNFLWPG